MGGVGGGCFLQCAGAFPPRLSVWVCESRCLCVCQQSIDELSTMLNGAVLAAETAGPNLRVRDKRPAQLRAAERTSHQRWGERELGKNSSPRGRADGREVRHTGLRVGIPQQCGTLSHNNPRRKIIRGELTACLWICLPGFLCKHFLN